MSNSRKVLKTSLTIAFATLVLSACKFESNECRNVNFRLRKQEQHWNNAWRDYWEAKNASDKQSMENAWQKIFDLNGKWDELLKEQKNKCGCK